MGRPKKQINEEKLVKEPVIYPLIYQDELDQEIDNEEETEEVIKKGEILVGNRFKIMVRDRYYEIYEKKKVKTKDESGVETEVELFKSLEVYLGTLIHACDHLKQHMAKSKLNKKGVVKSLDEAIKIIKESYKETQEMFEGIKGV